MHLGNVIVYVLLAVLTIYNIRINMRLFKLRSSNIPRDPRNLSGQELETIKAISSEKRKWVILSQILFWTSFVFVFLNSMAVLGLFLDLYTVACIVSNQIDLNATQILINKN